MFASLRGKAQKGRACRTHRSLWLRIRIDSIRAKTRRAISRTWDWRPRRRHWRANFMKAPDRFAPTSACGRCTGNRTSMITSRHTFQRPGVRRASSGGPVAPDANHDSLRPLSAVSCHSISFGKEVRNASDKGEQLSCCRSVDVRLSERATGTACSNRWLIVCGLSHDATHRRPLTWAVQRDNSRV